MYRKPWKRHYLSPGETAEILKVTPASLRGWTRKGILRAETTRGGHRRFPVSEVIRLARIKGLDVESSLLMSIRLLIIDSDIESCTALQKTLSSFAGVAKVEVAHDGFTAGCLVTQFHPDVMLLDLNVPGIDSTQICSFIKHDHRTKFIRVIAMCRNCSIKIQKQIVNLGAEVCFIKPLPLDSLKQTLGLEDLDD